LARARVRPDTETSSRVVAQRPDHAGRRLRAGNPALEPSVAPPADSLSGRSEPEGLFPALEDGHHAGQRTRHFLETLVLEHGEAATAQPRSRRPRDRPDPDP